MPPINDIPPSLRGPESKAAFIEWLNTLPVDFSTARRLIHVWSSNNHSYLTPAEWLQIESRHTRR